MTLEESLGKIGRSLEDKMHYNLKNKIGGGNSIATGRLYNTLRYIIRTDGDMPELDIYMAPYGKSLNDGNVDLGRRAYGNDKSKNPPIAAIKAWCKARGIDTSAAYAISNSIRKKGIKPTYFYTDAMASEEKNIEKVFEAFFEEQLNFDQYIK